MNRKQRKRKEKKAKAEAQLHAKGSASDISEFPNPDHAARAKPHEDQNTGTEDTMRKEPLSNWFLVAFTAALVGTSLLQWQAMLNAVSHSDDDTIIANRAYVVVKTVVVHPGVNEATGIRNHPEIEGIRGQIETSIPFLEVDLTNSGRTPAQQVSGPIYIEVRAEFIPDDYAMPTQASAGLVFSRGVIPPEVVMFADGPYQLGSNLSDVLEGRKFLMIYSVITYSDVFNRVRRTKFCSYYKPLNDRMFPCPHHNSIE